MLGIKFFQVSFKILATTLKILLAEQDLFSLSSWMLQVLDPLLFCSWCLSDPVTLEMCLPCGSALPWEAAPREWGPAAPALWRRNVSWADWLSLDFCSWQMRIILALENFPSLCVLLSFWHEGLILSHFSVHMGTLGSGAWRFLPWRCLARLLIVHTGEEELEGPSPWLLLENVILHHFSPNSFTNLSCSLNLLNQLDLFSDVLG